MNCPKCGKPMEEGTMYSAHYPYWTPERTEIRSFYVPKDAFRLRPVGDHTNSPLSPKAISSIHQFDTAICRACGTAVFSFEHKK